MRPNPMASTLWWSMADRSPILDAYIVFTMRIFVSCQVRIDICHEWGGGDGGEGWAVDAARVGAPNPQEGDMQLPAISCMQMRNFLQA